ncbi:MAG: DNA replication/repair protein RecF [Proteobacteria bacterium]|nr:DNA replication/repair protein RecF [Pseudomonadota bacterium]
MALTYLCIENIRNLEFVELFPCPGVNLIHGNNGAGKTSLLEAIHILGSGKSFRTSKSNDLRTHHKEMMRVIAKYSLSADKSQQIGWERDTVSRKIRINNETVQNVSELAKLIPVRAIQPDSHYRFRQQAKYRRSLLDWGVFHVEPLFQETWSRYGRILQQRNEYLKQGQIQESVLASWDEQLCSNAEIITDCRKQYMADWVDQIQSVYKRLFNPGTKTDISVSLFKGWDDENLLLQLKHDRARDIKKATTHSGCHRADIVIEFNQSPMTTTASQGQQKILVLSLIIAQIEILLAQNTDGPQPILLLDDVPSELDDQHRKRLMETLSKLPLQVFITSTEAHLVDISMWGESAMFHVEQGEIKTKKTVS